MPLIRDFRRSEFRQLWQIDQDCFEPGISYSQRELAWYMQRPGAFTLVAEQDGAICGFLVAAQMKGNTGHIITIDVVAPARRTGIGSELLRAAEDRLAREHCSAVQLEVAVNNAAAIRFYQRHGYSILRTIPRYYNGELDALLMDKPLAAAVVRVPPQAASR